MNQMFRKVCVFSLTVFASVAAYGADAQVEGLLSKMRSAYAAVKSAKIMTSSTFNGPAKASISVSTSYLRPNKIYAAMVGLADTKPGTKVVLYTDGKTIQMQGHPNGALERPYSLQNYLSGLTANLETICFWDYARQLSTTKGANMHSSKLKLVKGVAWNGKSWTVLEETAQGVFVRYFIDPNTYFINRTVVLNSKTNKPISEHTLKKLELNPAIDPKIFIIHPMKKDRVDV